MVSVKVNQMFILLFFIFIHTVALGLIENIGIVLMFVIYKDLRSPSNTLLLSLSIANLGKCVLSIM